MSERLDFKGDYMGFTYNNIHSSELGIVRTSDGSRFSENLLPTMQDKTVQVPGGDGTYYFGSYYTQRQFTVNFAFDSLTEEQLAKLRRVFGDKGEHDLIFDETPYKVYRAKVTGTATLKYLPFAEGSDNRVYKGEGSIQFTCYYPFAQLNKDIVDLIYQGKTGNDIKEELRGTYSNIDEWWDASRIEQGGNFGDLPAPFIYSASGRGYINLSNEGTGQGFSWNITNGQTYILNTKTGLATIDEAATDNYNEFEQIGNRYFRGNLLLKIPPNKTECWYSNNGIDFHSYELDNLELQRYYF